MKSTDNNNHNYSENVNPEFFIRTFFYWNISKSDDGFFSPSYDRTSVQLTKKADVLGFVI